MNKSRIVSLRSLAVFTLSLAMVAGCSGAGGNSSSTPAASGTTTAPAASATKVTKVTVTESTHSLLYAPMYIAQDNGYFKDEGIEVNIVTAGGGSTAAAGAVGGSAEVTAGALSHTIDVALQGKELTAFAASMVQWADPIVISSKIAKEKGITEQSSFDDKVKALKGLKLGITSPGSATDQIFRAILLGAGLNPDKDVMIVPLKDGGSILAGLKQGKIDAFSISSPTVEQALADGSGMMLINTLKGEYKPLDGMAYISFMAMTDEIKKNPELIQKFTNAIAKAEKFMAENPDKAEQTLFEKEFPKIDKQVFHLAYQDNIPAWAKQPAIGQKGAQLNIDFMAKVKGKAVNVDVNKIYTDEYANKAK